MVKLSSRQSEKQSWILSRRSIGRVHTSFSLHTRLGNVLAEDHQDAFDPNAWAVKLWDHVRLLCLLTEALLVPYFLAFRTAIGGSSTLFVLVILCEGVFALDMYVQAHTGYYTGGNLIRDKKLTIRRYVHSLQFGLDIVAVLPCEALVLVSPTVVPKLLLLKSIRWSRLPGFVSSLDEFYSRHFVALKLLKVLVATVYVAHVLACIRYSFGYDADVSNHWQVESSESTHALYEQYLRSLFWSIGIMTGLFEGELPHHSSEFIFTILVALCGLSMFTAICTTIFVISKCESGQTEALEARIHQLVRVLSFHQVPEAQQTQAIEYLKRYYNETESHNRETAKLLCPSIANDIQVELLKSTIAQMPIFAGCSDEFVVAVASLLEMVALPAQTTLFSAGDPGDAMYIVHSGVLAIVINSIVAREIRKGSSFGELSVFSSLPRTATVLSTTYVILYRLTRFHCERILEGYPESGSLVIQHVQEVLSQLNSSRVIDTSDASSSTKIQVGNAPQIEVVRRPSVAAGLVAGALAVIKVLHRRGSASATSLFGSRRNSGLWLGSQAVVSPTQQEIKANQGPTVQHVGHASQSTQGNILPSRRHLLLRQTCVDHQSTTRKWWLVLLLSNLCYCWLVIPLQVTFPLWQRPAAIILAADSISNAGLVLDMLLNFSLSFVVDAEKVLDPRRSAQRYLRSGFVFDFLCALPYEYLRMSSYGLLRLPRLLRVLHLRSHVDELAQFIPFSSRRQLVLLGILMFLLFHIVACIHFGISYLEGFNPNDEEAWISSTRVCLRRLNATHLENCNGVVYDEAVDSCELGEITALAYSRSLYYAVGVLASPGKSVEPTSVVQLLAAVTLMLGGFLVTAVVVDHVQKRFTASAFEQKAFFATRTRLQLFLRQQNTPLVIHHRVKSFLDYWWSSHRGAVISELLADLPRPMRLDLLRSICLPMLQTLALLQDARSVMETLQTGIVENGEFILYGQDEVVYRYGDHATGLYFLLEGQVCVVEQDDSSRDIPRGGFFGTAVLAQEDKGQGYTNHASANTGCVLLMVSREQLNAMETVFPTLKAELLALEQRLLDNKLVSMHMNSDRNVLTRRKAAPPVLKTVLHRVRVFFTAVQDPDSPFIKAWETWVFLALTVQCALVMFQACFPVDAKADALMGFLELTFAADMQLRSRLGFYEFGGKVMAPQRIKREYFRLATVGVDLVALLPLYLVNWALPSHQRWHSLNLNKLIRLLKIPGQLRTLERRYLKHTTELHLFKLLYYTFLLSHLLGCVWFNFASKAAFPSAGSSKPAFGENRWLPAEHLEHGSHVLQYTASLYWSFGLMSASSEPEFPKTTAQCLFSALTMTTGFFLFAYVIGNFTDIIELLSFETKAFNAKMRAVREMLRHFEIPADLQQRVQTFLLFKRYHTITNEAVLLRCLSPSLLTDIRLVHLKSMIDKVEFLRGMEGSITRMLVSQFTQVLVSRGEAVYLFGDEGRDMFFIFAGVLDVLVPTRTLPNEADSTLSARASDKSRARARSSSRVGPSKSDMTSTTSQRGKEAPDQLAKVHELSAGNYFGENALFTYEKRAASIQAQTSCTLYKLSRESIELVFTRYPKWKKKVVQIASIHREQERLERLSRVEQQRDLLHSFGLMLSHADIVNDRAERVKQELTHRRLTRGNSARIHAVKLLLLQRLKQLFVKLVLGFVEGIPVQGSFHLWWLRWIIFCTAYVAITVPYELVMDSMDRATVVCTIVKLLGLVCELSFIADVWFSSHVKESLLFMELYEQSPRRMYKKERMFVDLVAAVPVYNFLFVFKCRSWLKLLRCVKVFNIVGYLDELNRRDVANEATRFWQVCMLYLLAIYWAACAYLAVAAEVGFGTEWEAWLPSQELEISTPQDPSPAQLTRRFLRGLFFATTAFVKKARNVAPETAALFVFQISASFIGLITMSFVIGELASLVISHSSLEVGFRKDRIAVELYLDRLRISERLKSRAGAFLASFWSSHAGVNYNELLDEMPSSIRAACVRHASRGPLDWFVMKVMTPLCWRGNSSLEDFTLSLVQRLRFEGYPRDENVVTEGSVVRDMYFVVRGHLRMESSALLDRPVGLRSGCYFGERGLLSCMISAFTVRTVRACDLFAISSEAFAEVLQQHPYSNLAMTLCDRAYKSLKAAQITTCSRLEMEEHWGTSLLQVLRQLQSPGGEDSTGKARVEAEPTVKTEGTSFSYVDAVTKPTEEQQQLLAEQSASTREAGAKRKQCRGDMFEALDSAQSCFEAFAPLLYIMLATDPLDWGRTLGAEREEQETLLNQESVAMERRMKTLGIRDGLEIGKEDTLQEGFDEGFALGAARSFRFGRLRGALGAASACGLFSELNSDQVRDCMKQLRRLEMDTSIQKDGEEDTSLSSEAGSAVTKAQELLQSVGLEIMSASST